MRCPTCRESLVRQRGEVTELFFRKLVIRKSADRNGVSAVCPKCKTTVEIPKEVAEAIGRTIFLVKVKEAASP